MLRIHRALPPNVTVAFVYEVSDEKELAIRRRDCGGIISRSAAIRSNKVSSSRVAKESVEISESARLERIGRVSL